MIGYTELNAGGHTHAKAANPTTLLNRFAEELRRVEIAPDPRIAGVRGEIGVRIKRLGA